MVDPFERDTLLPGTNTRSRKLILAIFVPLIILAIFAISAFFMSIVAIQKARFHPECACKQILEENPPSTKYHNIMLGDGVTSGVTSRMS